MGNNAYMDNTYMDINPYSSKVQRKLQKIDKISGRFIICLTFFSVFYKQNIICAVKQVTAYLSDVLINLFNEFCKKMMVKQAAANFKN